jgi:hypothetical protein
LAYKHHIQLLAIFSDICALPSGGQGLLDLADVLTPILRMLSDKLLE